MKIKRKGFIEWILWNLKSEKQLEIEIKRQESINELVNKVFTNPISYLDYPPK